MESPAQGQKAIIQNVPFSSPFGEIVYTLIEHEWMSAQPTDTIDDFNGVYDFRTAFRDPFTF